jgi:serine/threonine-protein kinase
MGDVYLCKDTYLQREVVVKFIQDGVPSSFMDVEIKNLQSIRSKHVVEIYDLVKVPGIKGTGLVQEYLPGNDLTKLVPDAANAKTFLAKDAYLKLVYQIASGLNDIHQANVIHRDIKLNNMKLSTEGVVTIFDFGIAKSALEPETKGFKGTYGYAAPELYGGPPVKVTKAVDVYAFGVCAWFLAVGELPVGLRAMPPEALTSSLSAVRADLPAAVANILNKCVAFDPGGRPAIEQVQATVASYLVQGQHRGVLCSTTQRYIVSAAKSAVSVQTSQGKVTIAYNGVEFRVTLNSGDVYLNNKKLSGTTRLPGASVLVFGEPSLGPRRASFTFDVSHPEVVL